MNFKPGLTVLTGETGAGKSLIIEALSLIGGKRSDPILIHPSNEEAEITATFDIKKVSNTDLKSQTYNFPIEIKRILSKDGRSKNFCNGKKITLKELKLLTENLLDIHSQNQSQSLLRHSNQRKIIDVFGGLTSESEDVQKLYKEWKNLKDELLILKSEGKQENQISLLDYQIKELNEAKITREETTTIELQHKQLASAEIQLQIFQEILNLLNNNEINVLTLLNSAANSAQKLVQNSAEKNNLINLLEESLTNVNEALREVQHLSDSVSLDPEALSIIENRLSELHHLSRKHNTKITELYDRKNEIADKYSTLVNFEDSLKKKHEMLEIKFSKFAEKARLLSEKRKEIGDILSAEVSKNLSDLGMSGAQFKVKTVQLIAEPKEYGFDQIQFLIKTNPNTPFNPINKVASGGELSRVSLGIQAAISSKRILGCTVYDEVDAGIGGLTANIVGEKLRKLSTNMQVICITHSPQVAGAGNNHFAIKKTNSNNQTWVKIAELKSPERIIEIARMLGSKSPNSIESAHARELILKHQIDDKGKKTTNRPRGA